MGRYTFDELLKRWRLGRLSSDQAIGQILLLLQEFAIRLRTLEQGPGSPALGSPSTSASTEGGDATEPTAPPADHTKKELQ